MCGQRVKRIVHLEVLRALLRQVDRLEGATGIPLRLLHARQSGIGDGQKTRDSYPLCEFEALHEIACRGTQVVPDRKSTRLNSSHANISYAVFCLKKKKKN